MDTFSGTAEDPTWFSTYWLPFTVWSTEIPLMGLGCGCEICLIRGDRRQTDCEKPTASGVHGCEAGSIGRQEVGILFPTGRRVLDAASLCDLQSRLV